MDQNKEIKLFISYSHLDEKQVEKFIKHIAPLKTQGIVENWYDRKILAGTGFQNEIDNNLEDADIICLFISANFLSSEACMKEKKDALNLKREKSTTVVPIILSACGWLEDQDISSMLALPTDGNPISSFQNPDEAWNDVYQGLKAVLEKEIIVRQIKITNGFLSFLENTDLLSNAHSQKEEVLLDDIFVYPDLEKYSVFREYDKKENSKLLIENFYKYSKILIAGEKQSGKTTLCKKIFIELRKKKLIPVYLSDNTNHFHGKIENRISKALEKQYGKFSIDDVDKQRIVPIVDDFHFAQNKEKHIRDLAIYQHRIIVVDDIFSLNVKEENLINSFTHFKIMEYGPLLRNQLITKWTHLTDKKSDIRQNKNGIYESIDKITDLVNTALGKIIGSGIMPAYPFFILSVISTFETFEKPLDQEITSHGYCYQALIYLYLKKEGIKNDEVDTYINFLTEFAFFFYVSKKNELSKDEFSSFMKTYLEKYNLPIKQEVLQSKLLHTKIIALDNFNNYSFYYRYLYYFFVAKYIAEHVEDNKEEIDIIIKNLHKDENAYIAIFISHHSKNTYILDEIILNASCLFDEYDPAKLSKDELSFFDKQVENIVKAVLPPSNVTPEKERSNRLKAQEVREKSKQDKKNREENNSDNLAKDLRRSIKTIEVMGRIIKNRAGSLEKPKLELIFEEAMNVHLRFLTSFFDLIKHPEAQKEIVNFISNRLQKIIDEKTEERKKEGRKEEIQSKEELGKISKGIFWNMNFFAVYGFIGKIIHSLGSNQLTTIIEKVCEKENTPASFLIKHGMLMWFNKNLQVDNIAQRIDDDGFSDTATRVMKFLIVNHCSMHSIDFKEIQKIENKFKIPSQRLRINK